MHFVQRSVCVLTVFALGYDTMTTSPASTRSSFSSPKEASGSISQEILPKVAASDSDLNVSQMLADPVKLIDERIKVSSVQEIESIGKQ